IPLNRTFTQLDVISATMRAKSILRTACDEMQARYDNVHYWPSYEFVMWSGEGFREDDVRHVRREVAHEITRSFCRAFFDPADATRILGRLEGMDLADPAPPPPRRKKPLKRLVSLLKGQG
ncbi:MAG: GSCFA domain-containing protein, partial [Pseudomonadota bacterium]